MFDDVKQKAAEFASNNATTLLTAGGVVGTVATAVLAGRAGFKAGQIVLLKKGEIYAEQFPPEPGDNPVLVTEEWQDIEIPKKDLAFALAPHVIPPMLTGTMTVGAIIFANRMSAQKAAALAAAYGLAETQLSEYKAKVTEKLTGPKKQAIDDDLAQDRVSRSSGSEIIILGDNEVLCYDEPTGRYFRSTMEGIKSAVNATHGEILNHEYVRATFFYEEVGLPATTWTDEVGWNRDHLPELKISTVMSPDNRPCIAIDFTVLPKLDYVPKHY